VDLSTSLARIFKTANPAGWAWTFDRTDTPDAAIDNFATAANPNAALDALKSLIGGQPGTLSVIEIKSTAYEPQP